MSGAGQPQPHALVVLSEEGRTGVSQGGKEALESELLTKLPSPGDASFIDAIRGVTNVMRASVEHDRCIDVGQGDACVRTDGKTSAPVGYEQVAPIPVEQYRP